MFVNSSGSKFTFADDYRGIYVLTEKIKRDANRVDVEKPSSKHTAEPEISGGYVFKFDLVDPGDVGFQTPRQGFPINYVEPKEDDITAAQEAFIEGFLLDFENAL